MKNKIFNALNQAATILMTQMSSLHFSNYDLKPRLGEQKIGKIGKVTNSPGAK